MMDTDVYAAVDKTLADPAVRATRDRALDLIAASASALQVVVGSIPLPHVEWIDSKGALNEVTISIHVPNYAGKRACSLGLNTRQSRCVEAIHRHLDRRADPAGRYEEHDDFLGALNSGQVVSLWKLCVCVELVELESFAAWIGRLAVAREAGLAAPLPPVELTGDPISRIYECKGHQQFSTSTGHWALWREDPISAALRQARPDA